MPGHNSEHARGCIPKLPDHTVKLAWTRSQHWESKVLIRIIECVGQLLASGLAGKCVQCSDLLENASEVARQRVRICQDTRSTILRCWEHLNLLGNICRISRQTNVEPAGKRTLICLEARFSGLALHSTGPARASVKNVELPRLCAFALSGGGGYAEALASVFVA